MAIESPVLLAEGHDVTVFRSVDQAEAYAEAIDVDDGLYRAWDASGQALQLVADGRRGSPTSRKVHICLAEPLPGAPTELAQLLRDVLVESGVNPPAAGQPLSALVERFVEVVGYS